MANQTQQKTVAIINIDADDANADWIKWRSRESELAIHDEIDRQVKREQAVKATIKATIEARAAALDATVDKNDAGD